MMIKTLMQSFKQITNVPIFSLPGVAGYQDNCITEHGPVTMNQWCYATFRPHPNDYENDFWAVYYLPALQSLGRNLGRGVHSTAIAQLAVPGFIPSTFKPDAGIPARVTVNLQVGHSKWIPLQIEEANIIQEYQVVKHGSDVYAVIDAFLCNGVWQILLDRPLENSVKVDDVFYVYPICEVEPATYYDKIMLATIIHKDTQSNEELLYENGIALRHCKTDTDIYMDVLAGIIVL
jgi:hypothetical protein